MDSFENIALCAICQEMYIKPSCLPCGHVFCVDCLTGHLQRKRLCPICRVAVTEKQLPILLHGFDEMLDLLESNLPPNIQKERQARKLLARQGSTPQAQTSRNTTHGQNPSAVHSSSFTPSVPSLNLPQIDFRIEFSPDEFRSLSDKRSRLLQAMGELQAKVNEMNLRN